MNKKVALLLASVAALSAVPLAHAAVIGPTAYTSQADSPFTPANFSYFYLEDLEDDAVNTTGLTASGSGLCVAGSTAVALALPGCFANSGLTDSVGNGGNGNVGRSLWANGPTGITLDFSAAALGSLPTAVGLVWTDGTNNIRFEAFDANGVSLGVVTGNHADDTFFATLADDRFYGATNAGGISRVIIQSGGGGIEIDHIQYGGGVRVDGSVPEPATLGLLLTGLAAVRLRRRKLA